MAHNRAIPVSPTWSTARLRASWRGREIDKTDGFLLLFDDDFAACLWGRAQNLSACGLTMPTDHG
jgi:hypothetical protein